MRARCPTAVADALATVRASQASVATKRAFEFLVLTAARSGEVHLATWDQMDLDAGVWTIPAAPMKAKRDHRVPLSGRALATLHDVQSLSDGTGLVFRSLRGKPLSNQFARYAHLGRFQRNSIEVRSGISRNYEPPACLLSGAIRPGPADASLDGWNLATNARAVIAGPEVALRAGDAQMGLDESSGMVACRQPSRR